MRETIRIGTRGSALALWQARHVEERLQRVFPHLHIEIIVLQTRGDLVLDRPLAEIGGKGLFLKEIEEALLRGEVDMAVHSLKDVPWEQPEGLALAAVLERGAPYDALCVAPGRAASISALPERARVGTGSLRRGAQLRAMRPDLEVVPIRGNVPTRLARARAEGDLDAVVLAEAGLRRLDLWGPGMATLAPPGFLPAPAQGAVTVQVREDDATARTWAATLHDVPTALCVRAERACLHAIEGDCHTPFAAYAQRDADGIVCHARLLREDGAFVEHSSRAAFGADEAPLEVAHALGRRLGEALIAERARLAGEVPD